MFIKVNDIVVSAYNLQYIDVVEKPYTTKYAIRIKFNNGDVKYTGNYDTEGYGYDILEKAEIIK